MLTLGMARVYAKKGVLDRIALAHRTRRRPSDAGAGHARRLVGGQDGGFVAGRDLEQKAHLNRNEREEGGRVI